MIINVREIFTLRSFGGKTYHVAVFLLFLTYALFDGQKRIFSLLIATVVILFVSYFVFCKRWRFRIGSREFLYFSCISGLFFLFLAGQLFWRSNTHSFVVAAPIAIFIILVFSNRKMVERVLFSFVLLIVALAVVEKLTGSYIFVGESSRAVADGSTEVLLDEKLFAGAAGLLRAKSIFLGPLSLSAFMIGAAIVLRKSKVAVALCLLGVSLAISRTGIFLVSTVIFLMLFFAGNKNNFFKSVASVFVLISFFCILLALNTDILIRIYDALDFSGGSSTNTARVYFWSMAFFELSNYSVSQLIFGENGLYRSLYNNNAESGWLTLLLDFGILGVVFYLAPLVFVLVKSPLEAKAMAAVVLVANSVFTFCYGVTGCFIYWLTVYCLNFWVVKECE